MESPALRFSKKYTLACLESMRGRLRQKTAVVFSTICGGESAEASAVADISASDPVFVKARRSPHGVGEARARLVQPKASPRAAFHHLACQLLRLL